MPPLVAVVGPTASGKTELAIRIAELVGGEVVNSDSRQVYRGMDVGTAKPSAEDRARVPHHLFDIADPRDDYSLAVYRRQAVAALAEIWSRGAVPILCGGTGQYVWALLEGWTVPEVAPDDALREELRVFANDQGAEALHARLAAFDPVAAARIDPRNVRRVIRAIEVFEATGTPISAAQDKCDPGFQWHALALDVPRNELDRRIAERTAALFAAGFVEEVQCLLESGVPADAPALSSIGYREVTAHLAGDLSLEQAIEQTARATRRLVRRQLQWFRLADPRIHWFADPDDAVREAALWAQSQPRWTTGGRDVANR